MGFLAAIPVIGGIVEKVVGVVDKLVPDKDLATRLRHEMEVELLKQDWQASLKEFEDRADARKLAQADVEKGNAFTGMLAATVRPVWGFSALVVVIYPFVAGPLGLPPVLLDSATKDIIQTVIMFYFGGRTVEKVLPMVMGKK